MKTRRSSLGGGHGAGLDLAKGRKLLLPVPHGQGVKRGKWRLGRKTSGGNGCIGMLCESWPCRHAIGSILPGLKETLREFLSEPKGWAGSELLSRLVKRGAEGSKYIDFGLVYLG